MKKDRENVNNNKTVILLLFFFQFKLDIVN